MTPIKEDFDDVSRNSIQIHAKLASADTEITTNYCSSIALK
jgi:hypothetical protein